MIFLEKRKRITVITVSSKGPPSVYGRKTRKTPIQGNRDLRRGFCTSPGRRGQVPKPKQWLRNAPAWLLLPAVQLGVSLKQLCPLSDGNCHKGTRESCSQSSSDPLSPVQSTSWILCRLLSQGLTLQGS